MQTKTPDVNDLLAFGANKTLETMYEKMMAPNVTPEEFQESFKAVGGGLKALSKQIRLLQEALIGEVSQRPTSFDPVLQAVATLEASVKSMVQAISAIKLPSMPDIPKPADLDLSSVLSELESLRMTIAAMPAPVVEVEHEEREETPRNWIFNVNRGQGGYIRSVDVVAQ